MTDMPHDSVAVPRTTIDWYRSTPWWRLASQSVTIAWRASHLGLCVAALLLTHWVSQFTHVMFGPEEVDTPVSWVTPKETVRSILPFDGELASMGLFPSVSTSNPSDSKWYAAAPDSFLGVWRRYANGPFQSIQLLTVRRAAYVLVNFAAMLAIWSFVGGCLARRSIVEMGTRISIPWTETLSLVAKRTQSIAWSIAMPLAPAGFCLMVVVLVGWISNVPYAGPWLAGILMIPVAFLFIGVGWSVAVSLFGFSLSTSAIVCEKQADAFDGLSRAAAYTFQRPLTLILGIAAAELISRFAGAILVIVFNSGFSLIASAFEVGSFYQLNAMGTVFDYWYSALVPLFVTAFGFSFFWTASAAIYLVLRKDVDNAEFDLIDMGNDTPAKELPPLPEKPEVQSKSEPATE